MKSPYATAFEQIREILESRTQAMPILTSKEVSEELTCWPIPPLRKIREFMQRTRAAKSMPTVGGATRRVA
jgi:hypothetical protein